MKYTAWSMIGLGILIATYWGATFAMERTTVLENGQPHAMNFSSFGLLLFSGIVVVLGTVMLVYGGKGYIQTKNPAIHN